MTARNTAVAALLARVRDAVRAQPVTVRDVPSHAVVRRVSRDATNLADLFATKATAVGMRVTRVDAAENDAGLDAALATLIAKHAPLDASAHRAHVVVAVRDAGLASRALAAAGNRSAPNDNDDLLFDCAVGITDVDCVIAESGSLVISTNGRIRNAWITPPIHIAIVRADQILPDLVDLFELRPDAIDAASTTIITGPSKTADIEGVLVTGVHGPAAVEIVLVG